MSLYGFAGEGSEVVHLKHWSICEFENGKGFFDSAESLEMVALVAK